MKIQTLAREESKAEFDKLVKDGLPTNYDHLDQDYKNLRNTIISSFNEEKSLYEIDLNLAINFYDALSKINNFNEIVASNYDFFRYICLKVAPDVIYKRHGLREDYYFAKRDRMYFASLWWYIHMCYQGDLNETKNQLKRYNTDLVLQLNGRTGRDGFYLPVIRKIIEKLNTLPMNVVNKEVSKSNLIRRVLIQNTAKIENYNLIFEDKIDKYVVNLFRSCGVEVK